MAMAVSTRTLTTLGVAVGAGVLAGAGQLGVGYGLGILRWDRDFTADTWHTQLAWVAFVAAVAVIGGALAGRRRDPTRASGRGWRAALVAAAAFGSLVVLPLAIKPAGASHLAEAGSPRLTVAITAGAGLALGVLAAVAVLSVPVVSGNIISCVVWVWIAGTVSAVTALGGGDTWGTARLGLLPATGAWVPLTLLGVAVVIGAAVAGLARLGGNGTRATGASGAAGPALVAAAYLIAGPGTGVAASAYRYALIAVLAGVAVSVLLAVLGRRPAVVPAVSRNRELPALPGLPVAPAPAAEPAGTPWETSTTDRTAGFGSPERDYGSTPDYGWTAVAVEPPRTSWPVAPTEPVSPAPTPAPQPQAEPAPKPPSRAASRRKGSTGRGKAAAPVPEQPPAVPDEPAAKPGRRSRGRGDTGPVPESDYVDWVKGLSSADDDKVRVGGTARHAKPGDRDSTRD
jgi:hypothetical protein